MNTVARGEGQGLAGMEHGWGNPSHVAPGEVQSGYQGGFIPKKGGRGLGWSRGGAPSPGGISGRWGRGTKGGGSVMGHRRSG